MIGASGAISGDLSAYILLYPQARVLVVIPIFFIIQTVRIPAMFVLGASFLMQLFSSFMAVEQESGMAFGAYIGGFVTGMLLTVFKHRHIKIHTPFAHFHLF